MYSIHNIEIMQIILSLDIDELLRGAEWREKFMILIIFV
jgi:hypothetical protein